MNNKYVRNNKKNKEMLLLNLSEKKYRFEIFYLSIWLDMDFSLSEQETMKRLNPKFALDKSEQMESIVFIEHYIFSEQNRIFHFHPKIKQIKERFLINIKSEFAKNKERIIKEISESKELLFLLRKSTQKKLNKEEKTKIREQLMDILKVIPSFSILMLPAGTVILPLILKILPKKTLYPSSFLNDNFEINIDKDD